MLQPILNRYLRNAIDYRDSIKGDIEMAEKNKHKRESARAQMRRMIKRLLKEYDYPPEGYEDAVQTVMTQCELWTDNNVA